MSQSEQELDYEFLAEVKKKHLALILNTFQTLNLETKLGVEGVRGLAEVIADQNTKLDLIQRILVDEIPILEDDVSEQSEPIPTPRLFASGQWPAADLTKVTNNVYPLEETEDKKLIRWTGPVPECIFSFPADRTQKLTVKLNAAAVIHRSILSRMVISSEKKPLSYRIQMKPNIAITFDLPILETKEFTSVSLKLSNLLAPDQIGRSVDKRPLGIALSDIEFYPYEKTRLSAKFRNFVLKLRLRFLSV